MTIALTYPVDITERMKPLLEQHLKEVFGNEAKFLWTTAKTVHIAHSPVRIKELKA